MKSTIFQPVILALVALVCCGVSTAQAQGGPGLVAILDVAKVFEGNTSFTKQMEAIKADAEQLKIEITKQQDEIKKRAEALVGFERGSNDRNQLEAKLEIDQTALRTYARQKETELLNREALIYFDTYKEMQAVVESLATQYNLSLVLRFDSEPIDESNRNEVIKGVNRAVVFHRKLDLTGIVSEQLNARLAQNGGTTIPK